MWHHSLIICAVCDKSTFPIKSMNLTLTLGKCVITGMNAVCWYVIMYIHTDHAALF